MGEAAARLWQERAPYGPWFVVVNKADETRYVNFGSDKTDAEKFCAALNCVNELRKVLEESRAEHQRSPRKGGAMNRLNTLGYRISGKLAVLRVDHGQPWGWLENLWLGIWYRYRCPRPVIADCSARACVEGGHCGCDNAPRYKVLAKVSA